MPSERAWSTERIVCLVAVDEDPAAVRALVAGQDLDQRRLARAVVADEPEHLALAEVHRDVDERGDRAEALRDVLDANRSAYAAVACSLQPARGS